MGYHYWIGHAFSLFISDIKNIKSNRVFFTFSLLWYIRLIKHDIRINAGPKHILDALNPAAYEAFHASLDLEEVVRQSLAEGW